MRKLVLVMGLVVVAFACSEQAGQMLVDGGQMMMDAGDAMVPDAGAQTAAQCDQTHVQTGEGFRIEYRYAVVTVGNPRNAIVEQCWSESLWTDMPPNVRCQVIQHARFDGNDIYIGCGSKSYDAEGALVNEQPGPASITVYE